MCELRAMQAALLSSPPTLSQPVRAILYAALTIVCLGGCNSFNKVELGPFSPPSDELTFRRLYSEGGQASCIGRSGPSTRILLIPIQGVIAQGQRSLRGTSPSQIQRTLKLAARDTSIKAILLKVDSPGGTVSDSDIILRMITRFADKRKLPVYAHIDDLAASGGYYVAMSAAHLNVVPTGRVGSIGVIMQSFSAAGLMEKLGLKDRSIVSGRNKDTLSPFRDLRDDEREFLQHQINEMHDRFVGIVQKSRGGRMDIANLRQLADGRVYTAKEALREHLVDSSEYLDEFLARIKRERKFSPLEVVAFLPEGRRYDSLYDVAQQESTPAEMLRRLVPVGMRGMLYLWPGGL